MTGCYRHDNALRRGLSNQSPQSRQGHPNRRPRLVNVYPVPMIASFIALSKVTQTRLADAMYQIIASLWVDRAIGG